MTHEVKEKAPAVQLNGFLRKFTPEIAKRTKTVLVRMRALLPGAIELVYDNYNALAIGYATSERTSEAIFSIAVYPRWVSLFFLQSGTKLSDPKRLLKGNGNKVRYIVLESADDLDRQAVRSLMAEALELSTSGFDVAQENRIVIKSISAKQRPRRPACRLGQRASRPLRV